MMKLRLAYAKKDYLLIKLPIRPSTIEELALIRFWLLKLSQAYFENINAKYSYQYKYIRGILNPEFLSVINPRTGPRKILFHANDVDLYETEIFLISADFAKFLCARRITLYGYGYILDELLVTTSRHRDNLFKFIMGTGNARGKFRIYYSGSNQGKFCEFIVKVNFHHRSFCFKI
jgi:hypothetical protein